VLTSGVTPTMTVDAWFVNGSQCGAKLFSGVILFALIVAGFY
jgi:hypothetical protein